MMSSVCVLLLLCASACVQLHLTRALLNLDPLSPTVVRSGIADSAAGFGWTLAQHSFRNGRKVVLVSAPKANGSTTQEEGGVYSCPFDVREACQFQAKFQDRELNNQSDLFLTGLNSEEEAFEGQLMGYSLKSSGSSVMACAPLYVQTLTSRSPFRFGDPSGRCIILDSDLNITHQVFPDKISNMVVAGLDVEFFSRAGSEGFVLSNTYRRGDSGVARGGQLIRSDGVTEATISRAALSAVPNVPLLILQGFHLEQGYFTQLQTPEIVSSAPRALDHRGKIEILSLELQPTTFLLSGDEADGYYGYDFAVLDLGHGGYSSLAVGCPLCAGERGRVYIYAHTGDPSMPLVTSTLTAPSSGRGRFGLAVENIGDIDQDGLSDLAVSAPYEGSGVVYIYRGSETGVVADDFQAIPAVQGSTVFGYSLSGGLDVDNNGYPDLSIGDLSGRQVTTIRTSPLVNVTLEVPDKKTLLNITGGSDQLCPLDDNSTVLHCFNVTPCFYYEEIQNSLGVSSNVAEIDLVYTLSVDNGRSRVLTYSASPEGVVTRGQPEVTGTVTISGQGRESMACAPTSTFALSADFVDIDSIPVSLSIKDAPRLLPLGSESEGFGGPLHPVIRRYVRGADPAPITLQYTVSSNVNCGSGDPGLCEGVFQLEVTDLSGERSSRILASSSEFGYSVEVTNVASDTAVSPVLIIQLPQQTTLSRTVPPTTCNFRAEATPTNGSIRECALKNPMLAGETVAIETYFEFNDTMTLFGVRELEVRFSILDGGTQTISGAVRRSFRVEAISEYFLTASLDQLQYRALRSAVVFPDPGAIPLDRLGPSVILSVIAQNRQGSIFPRSTLYIHFPVELLTRRQQEGEGRRILMIPFRVVVNGNENVNCSHFQAIPEGLPAIQQPSSTFLPPWQGTAPPPSAECQRGGIVRCGTILCTLFDLQPPPQLPTTITVFARLYSPAVGNGTQEMRVFAQLESNTALPELGGNSVNTSVVSFSVAPGVLEVQRECIRYWVVVVSVGVGLAALLIIILLCAACGLFRRWYKIHQDDNVDGTVRTNDFQPRIVPPLTSLTFNGHPSPTAGGYWEDGKKGDGTDEGMSTIQREKEREALQAVLNSPQTPLSPPAADRPLDPNAALDDNDFEGGMETDL